MSSNSAFTKDPDATLDYMWDWSSWLDDGDTIVAATVVAETGISVDSYAINAEGTAVTAWISGGTPSNKYRIVNHIQTNDGREDDRTITILCLDT